MALAPDIGELDCSAASVEYKSLGDNDLKVALKNSEMSEGV